MDGLVGGGEGCGGTTGDGEWSSQTAAGEALPDFEICKPGGTDSWRPLSTMSPLEEA
jgi:hypothetical protein